MWIIFPCCATKKSVEGRRRKNDKETRHLKRAGFSESSMRVKPRASRRAGGGSSFVSRTTARRTRLVTRASMRMALKATDLHCDHCVSKRWLERAEVSLCDPTKNRDGLQRISEPMCVQICTQPHLHVRRPKDKFESSPRDDRVVAGTSSKTRFLKMRTQPRSCRRSGTSDDARGAHYLAKQQECVTGGEDAGISDLWLDLSGKSSQRCACVVT